MPFEGIFSIAALCESRENLADILMHPCSLWGLLGIMVLSFPDL